MSELSAEEAQPPELAEPDEEEDRLQVWLRTGVVISDPESVEGLLEHIPTSATIIRGTSYNTKVTTGKMVHCRACPQKQMHYRGFVVETDEGSKALVGIDCGERHFFENGVWQQLIAASERQKTFALYQERSAGTVEKLRALIPDLRHWATDAARLEALVHELDDVFPDVWSALAEAARGDGTLMRLVEIETPYKDRAGNDRSRKSWERQRVANLPAPWLFSGPSLARELARLCITLAAVADKLEHGEQTLSVRAGAFADIRKARARLRELDELHKQALAFFHHDFIDSVAKWVRYNHFGQGTLRFKRGRLHASSEADDFGSLAIPPPAELPTSPWAPIAAQWPRL